MQIADPARTTRAAAVLGLAALTLAACAAPTPRLATRLPESGAASGAKPPSGAGGRYKVGKPYQVGGVWYVPKEDPNYNRVGVASWYGPQFHNKATANGETFDMNALTAAHTTLPLPSLVEVTNLENGRKVIVRVNDRGPFVGDRIIDLSKAAARELDFARKGLARVRVRYVGRAPLGGGEDLGVRTARAEPAPALPAAPIPYSQLARTTPAPAPPPAPAAAPAYSPPAVTPPSTSSAYLPPPGAYRVQAAAFGDRLRAERALDLLAGSGEAVIAPVETGGGTLYRVMLNVSGDEGRAWAVRDQVASVGFADARVIHPY